MTQSGDKQMTVKTDQIRDYLTIIQKEGKDVKDPIYLMQAFGITRNAARREISAWLEEEKKDRWDDGKQQGK